MMKGGQMLDFTRLSPELRGEVRDAAKIALEVLSVSGCICHPKILVAHSLDAEHNCDCGDDDMIFAWADFTDEAILSNDLDYAAVGFSMRHEDECVFPSLLVAPFN